MTGYFAFVFLALMGFLIGAQREASQGEGHPGVRDFVLIALIGAVCGLLQNPWLTVAALAELRDNSAGRLIIGAMRSSATPIFRSALAACGLCLSVRVVSSRAARCSARLSCIVRRK